jgi:hypothetical protein
MYLVNGFRANVSERDLRWLCVLMKTLRDWPDKSRAIFECMEKCGGFLLMTRPKKCLEVEDEREFCHLCKYCTARDRENVHRFLETLYEIGQFKSETRGVPLHFVKFMSIHGCDLFKEHKLARKIRKPAF